MLVQVQISEPEFKQRTEDPKQKSHLMVVGESLLVLWILGIFYYFYNKQVFFELVQQIFNGTL